MSINFEEILKIMLVDSKYYNAKELIYDTNVGIMMSPFEYKQFLDYKINNSLTQHRLFFGLDLKTFNSPKIYFYIPSELSELESNYLDLIEEDLINARVPLSIRNIDDFTLSRIYSEVEGSLNIEAVPTTRKAVVDIASGKRNPKTLNEQIIKNMIDGVSFVNQCPDFNEDNLFELYSVLSNGCLDEEDKLLPNHKYRHDGVEIGRYKGCPTEQVKECMDSLFNFINSNLKNNNINRFLPHIAHYYVLYVHPYFDYNGRTARMVSYWVSLLVNHKIFPPVISEAINQTKAQYYSAISETRDSGNDLTYFLLYIYKVSISYFLTYKNIEEIEQNLKNKSIVLTNTDKAYIKKILISNRGKFTHEDFTKWVDVNMSKQGAFKFLNAYCDYGILNSSISTSNKKLFEVNPSMIKYRRIVV